MKEQQRYEKAATHFSAALERSAQAGEVGKVALANLEFGDLALIRGRYDEARQYLEASLTGFERAGQAWGTALALDVRGYLACKEGELRAAEELFRRALEIAVSRQLYPFASNIMAGLALVGAGTGDPQRAVELLTLVQRHPATERQTLTRRVVPLLAELQGVLSGESFALAVSRGSIQPVEALFSMSVITHGRQPHNGPPRS